MNEQYLWDKSGEPDPEVQHLEEILGTLRYQPRPLDIPKQLVVERRRSLMPLFAIAASIALVLTAAGLWAHVQNQKVHQPTLAIETPGGVTKEPSPVAAVNNGNGVQRSSDAVVPRQPRRVDHRHIGNQARVINSPPANLTIKDRTEAMAAKEQLMVALRVASEKLNLAQRRTQGVSPVLNRNQHKVG